MATERLRWAIGAASLGILLAGCPGPDPAPEDLSATSDFTMVQDMAVPADMTAASLPSAQLVVAEVFGTAYRTVTVPDAGEQAVPAHSLGVVASFPSATDTSDFSNLNINTGTFTISGCVSNRYSATGHKAPADVDVGTITISGYKSANRFAFSPLGPAAQGNVYAEPLPTTVECKKDATSGYYGCSYAGAVDTTPPIQASGTNIGFSAFPSFPQTGGTENWNNLCTLLAANAGACQAACEIGPSPPLPANFCWQPLINAVPVPADAGTGTTITINSPTGGGIYSRTMQPVANTPPGNVFITGIRVGGTSVGTTLGSLQGQLDPTKMIEIDYSCDPAQPTTKGAGCSGLSPLDAVTVTASTSPLPRATFLNTANYGSLNCLQITNRAGSTVTIPAGAVAAMLGAINGGTAQNTGSVRFIMIRMIGQIVQLSPNQLFSVGKGQFALLSLP
jgi:hypothetical protein